MKPVIIELRKIDGKFTDTSRLLWQQSTEKLRDGVHEAHLFANMHRTYKGRYKYYFSYMLPEIIRRCKIMIVSHQTGEERFATTMEFHNHLKQAKNGGSIINPLTNKVSLVGLSTTKLDDNEFINEYEDEILFDYMTAKPDAFQDFLTREEWVEAMKAKYELRDKIDSK